MAKLDLNKILRCSIFLEDPGPEVVHDLVERIKELEQAINQIKRIAETEPKDKAILAVIIEVDKL